METRKIVIGISGASGAVYARALLDYLERVREALSLQVALVVSAKAEEILQYELPGYSYHTYGFRRYGIQDFNAPFASGSGAYDTMIVIPCSMGHIARMASGSSDNVLLRAADVMLKERRRLICVVREMPYSAIHLENMLRLTRAGGIICPASPHFYSRPDQIDTLVATVVERVLDLAYLSKKEAFRWGDEIK